MHPLSTEVLRTALRGVNCGPFGSSLHYFQRVPSTNDIAREQALIDTPEGAVVVADVQTKGRGRHGRSWVAEEDSSLLMTTLFRPEIPAARVNRIVMVCGLAIAEACETFANVKVEVKWPNDLLIKGKKFCGILPESALVDDRIDWVIVGTGININNLFLGSHDLAGIATSLRQETNQIHNRIPIFSRIMVGYHHWYSLLDDPMLSEVWQSRCVTIGQLLEVRLGEKVYRGVAEALDANGALILRDDDDKLHTLAAGEATLRKSDTD